MIDSASTGNRSSPPLKIFKMAHVQGSDCFCLRYLLSDESWWIALTQKAMEMDLFITFCDSSNRCHAMIHHQNADAMFLASAHLRGIPPGHLPWILSRGWMPLKRALARTMASAFWWPITVTPKSLENHRKNQEVGLLCSLLCASVSNLSFIS
jgi:hypothetical protein